MLILRYFLFVGGALFGLLWLSAEVFQGPAVDESMAASASDVPSIRIRSQQRWPERVVLDTNAKMPASPVVAGAIDSGVNSQSTTAKTRVRDAFAQLPSETTKAQTDVQPAQTEMQKAEAKRSAKRHVAKVHTAPQAYPPQGYYPQQGYYGYSQSRMRVAQQPRFGFLW